MAYRFNIAFAVKSTIDLILNINILLVLATDLKSLYDCLAKLGITQEKRLIIGVICLC